MFFDVLFIEIPGSPISQFCYTFKLLIEKPTKSNMHSFSYFLNESQIVTTDMDSMLFCHIVYRRPLDPMMQ